MNPQNKWLKIVGIVLNVLVAGMLIFAGSGKAFGFAPESVTKQLGEGGLANKLQLIGFGELTCALLLLLPWTSPLGVLMTSGFWGGAICFHISRWAASSVQARMLVVTVI